MFSATIKILAAGKAEIPYSKAGLCAITSCIGQSSLPRDHRNQKYQYPYDTHLEWIRYKEKKEKNKLVLKHKAGMVPEYNRLQNSNFEGIRARASQTLNGRHYQLSYRATRWEWNKSRRSPNIKRLPFSNCWNCRLPVRNIYWLDFLSASQIKTIYLLVVIKILDGKEQPSKMYQAP